jgi:hypothetical protein
VEAFVFIVAWKRLFSLLRGSVCFHCCVEAFVFIVALKRLFSLLHYRGNTTMPHHPTGGRGYVTKET